MQRDFGDELLIAVVAIGVIAFAVVFGIVLSLVGAPSPESATLVPPTLVASGETLTPADAVPTAMTAVITVSETPAENATSSLTNIPTAGDSSTATLGATDAAVTAETPSAQATDTQVPVETETVPPSTEESASISTAAPENTSTDTPVNTDEPTATETSEPTSTNTPEPSATHTVDPTATDTPDVLPSATDTLQPTATDTVAPTDTATDTPEPTATETPAPTVTDTVAPSTNTPEPTATDTEEPTPTSTSTPEPTATDTATATATPTDTPEPTATSTETPSATPTDTPTATNTDTPTMTPTDTPTFTPTATLTASPTAIPTGTRDDDGVCLYPPGYGRYIAGTGDTLETLASAADLPAEDLRGANCFAPDTEIITGDVVYVPQDAEATPTPDGTDVAWTMIGCENPMLARITAPVQGAVVTGSTPIVGTAFASDFVGYRLELRSDESVEYELLRELQVPALQSVLGTLDLTDREPGLYWLRLVVTTADSELADGAVCVVPVFASAAND